MTPASVPPSRMRRPAWAGRNYSLLTAAAIVTSLGSHGALIAAAFAVLESGGDGGDVGLVAAARTAAAGPLPAHRRRHRRPAAAPPGDGRGQRPQLRLAGRLRRAGPGRRSEAVADDAAHRAVRHRAGLLQPGGRGHADVQRQRRTGQPRLRPLPDGDARRRHRRRGARRRHDRGDRTRAGCWPSTRRRSRWPGRCAPSSTSATSRRAQPGGGLLSDLRDGWQEFIGRPWLWSHRGAVLRGGRGGRRPPRRCTGRWSPGTSSAAPAPGVSRSPPSASARSCGALLMMRWKPRRLLLAGTLCVFPLALPSAALAVPLPVAGLSAVMFVSGVAIEVFGVSWMTAHAPGDPGGEAVPGLGVRLVRIGGDAAAGHRARRSGGGACRAQARRCGAARCWSCWSRRPCCSSPTYATSPAGRPPRCRWPRGPSAAAGKAPSADAEGAVGRLG